jgi:hypothetical protein
MVFPRGISSSQHNSVSTNELYMGQFETPSENIPGNNAESALSLSPLRNPLVEMVTNSVRFKRKFRSIMNRGHK